MPISRQLRLSDALRIQERIQEFAGKTISLVLRDSRVANGTLIDIQKDYVTLLNTRKKRMRFEFNDISELYFDTLDKC